MEKTQANLLRTIRELKKRLQAQDEQLARFKQAPTSTVHLKKQSARPRSSKGVGEFARWFAANIVPSLGVRLSVVVVDVNGRICDIYGSGPGAIANPEVVRGTPWVDWIVPDDQPRWRTFAKMSEGVHDLTPLSFSVRPEFAGPMTAVVFPGRLESGEVWIVLRETSYVGAAVKARSEDPARHWAGVYAHELNQPLTAVLTTAQACRSLLSAGKMPLDEMVQGMDAMIRRGHYAADIVRRLRTLAGGVPPARVTCDLSEIVRRGLDVLQTPLEQSRTRVTFAPADELPEVNVDSVQIVQVVVNLVRNAMEAMSGFPVTRRQITVRTQREPREAIVSVEDQGVGLSVDVIHRLFQPIVSTKSSGMGLGLALCRQIVEAHGGRIWAKGNSPRGCVFFFSVPFPDEDL